MPYINTSNRVAFTCMYCDLRYVPRHYSDMVKYKYMSVVMVTGSPSTRTEVVGTAAEGGESPPGTAGFLCSKKQETSH